MNFNKKKSPFAQFSILSFLDDKMLNKSYSKDKIIGCKFIEVSNVKDIFSISDSDMIFILATKEIDLKYINALKQIGEEWTLKILISNNNLPKLNMLCDSKIISNPDFITTHSFLRKLIETVLIPGLTGIDYAELRHFIFKNKLIHLKTYVGEYNKKQDTINKIKSMFNKKQNCFFVLAGGDNMILDDVMTFQKEFEQIFKDVVVATKMDFKMTNSFELYLFIGNEGGKL